MQRVITKKLSIVIFSIPFFMFAAFGLAVSPYESNFDEDDWLKPVLVLINANDYQEAIKELKRADKKELADWNNLMGYSLRKLSPPDLFTSEKYYQRALSIEPDHKAALEYYGELKLMQNDLEGAEKLLKQLQHICPTGCEEFDILTKAVESFKSQ